MGEAKAWVDIKASKDDEEDKRVQVNPGAPHWITGLSMYMYWRADGPCAGAQTVGGVRRFVRRCVKRNDSTTDLGAQLFGGCPKRR